MLVGQTYFDTYLNEYKGCKLQVQYLWWLQHIQLILFYFSQLVPQRSPLLTKWAHTRKICNTSNHSHELVQQTGLWDLRFSRQWWRFKLTCHVHFVIIQVVPDILQQRSAPS